MIAQNFEYAAPTNLSEALKLLGNGEAKALAGGMSLIPLMKLRLATPEQVVDLGRIAGLNYIRQRQGRDPHRRHHHALRDRKLRAVARQLPASGGSCH